MDPLKRPVILSRITFIVPLIPYRMGVYENYGEGLRILVFTIVGVAGWLLREFVGLNCGADVWGVFVCFYG